MDRTYEPNAVIPGTIYRVVREIGQGGMGCVYEVEDTTIGKPYALKVLRDAHASGAGDVDRMKVESRTLVRVAHPNIVDVITAGVTADGSFFYVMELLTGRSLRRVLKDAVRLRPSEAVAIGIDIGEALVKAHRAGIVHRDVKPDNIFVVKRQDLTTQAKLLDFGVAAMLDNLRTLRETGKLLGTPRYASPQQQRGEKAHPSMDIWALGYVLFEAMVGHGPFRGRTLEEIVVAVQSADPAFRVSDFLPDVYGPLDKLLAWMLEKEVSKRAASVEDVTEILRKISTAMLAPARPLGQDDSTVDSMLGLVHRTSPGDGKPHVAKSPSAASAEGSTTATPPFFADPPGAVARPAAYGTPRGQVPTESSLLAAGEVADAERDPQALDRAWGLLSGEAKAVSLPTPQPPPARDLSDGAPERVNGREETSPPWNRSGSIPAVTVRNGVRVAVAGAAAGVLAFAAVAGVRLARKSPVVSSPTAESTVVRSNGDTLPVTIAGLQAADRHSAVFDAGASASSAPEPATPTPPASAALAPDGAASKTRPASRPVSPAGSVRTQTSTPPPPPSKKPSYDVF